MKFKIMCRKGDSLYDYNNTEMAEIKFNELVGDGLLPMVIEKPNNRILTKFESGIEEIIWMPAVVGG